MGNHTLKTLGFGALGATATLKGLAVAATVLLMVDVAVLGAVSFLGRRAALRWHPGAPPARLWVWSRTRQLRPRPVPQIQLKMLNAPRHQLERTMPVTAHGKVLPRRYRTQQTHPDVFPETSGSPTLTFLEVALLINQPSDPSLPLPKPSLHPRNQALKRRWSLRHRSFCLYKPWSSLHR